MSNVLITTSILVCSHPPGSVSTSLTAGQNVLQVAGQSVVAQPIAGIPLAGGCSNNNPGSGLTPCLHAVSQTLGGSQVLMINGVPAVLENATGPTDSAPPGIWTVQTVNQNVLQTNDG